MVKNTKVSILTPRQSAYMQAYTNPSSPSFGNSYRSAVTAGYSDQSARNFTTKRTGWVSDFVGDMAISAITPDEIMTELTRIIHDDAEPTIVRLKSIELTMRAYNMLLQNREAAATVVSLNIDLSGD